MTPSELYGLLAWARFYAPPREEKEAQIRSFAYGNVKLHNPSITREDIARETDKLNEDKKS